MVMTEIERVLESVIERMEVVFKLIEQAGTLSALENLPTDFLPLIFRINLKITKNKKFEEFSLSVSPDAQKLVRGYSAAFGHSISGPEEVWMDVLEGRKNLIGEVVEGHLKVSNLRVNWLKTMFFSHLLSNLVSSKLLKTREV